jgi:hypothetical protein
MYATVDDMRKFLPVNITIGNNNIGVPSPSRPGSTKDIMTTEQAEKYIQYSTQEIDGKLRPYYICPIRRIKSYETELTEDLPAGNNVSAYVWDSGAFGIGNTVRLQDQSNMEYATVVSIDDVTKLTLSRVVYGYSKTDGLISIVEYPDPLQVICARLSVGIAFEQLFASEQSGNESEYGKTQKAQANELLESVLTGEILLQGQDFSGRRFIRVPVADTFKSPADVKKSGQ